MDLASFPPCAHKSHASHHQIVMSSSILDREHNFSHMTSASATWDDIYHLLVRSQAVMNFQAFSAYLKKQMAWLDKWFRTLEIIQNRNSKFIGLKQYKYVSWTQIYSFWFESFLRCHRCRKRFRGHDTRDNCNHLSTSSCFRTKSMRWNGSKSLRRRWSSAVYTTCPEHFSIFSSSYWPTFTTRFSNGFIVGFALASHYRLSYNG